MRCFVKKKGIRKKFGEVVYDLHKVKNRWFIQFIAVPVAPKCLKYTKVRYIIGPSSFPLFLI